MSAKPGAHLRNPASERLHKRGRTGGFIYLSTCISTGMVTPLPLRSWSLAERSCRVREGCNFRD